MEDLELLRAYVNGDGDQPLTELVRRHLHWVYASALRQVRDPQLAEDVAQAVFIALAQKARSLARGAVISAWPFKVTRYASAKALRTEGRRRQHEQKAAAMRSEVPVDESDWQELSPLLDELVGRLGQKHQRLILLRFYQQKSFAEVAAALGITEEAARKRAERAVEELRAGFARRGVAVGTPAALVGALGVHCAASASAELVSAATAGALAAGKGAIAAAAPLALAKGAMVTMAWSKACMAAAVIVVALVCGTGLVVAAQAAIASATTNPADFTTEPKVQELLATLEQEEQRYQHVAFTHHREIATREIVPAGQAREPQSSTQTLELQAVYQGEYYWQSGSSTYKRANDLADVTRSVICCDGKEAKSREGEKPVTISPAAPKVNPYSPFVMLSLHPGMPLSASLTDQFPAELAKLGLPGTVRIRRVGDDMVMGLRCIVLEATFIAKEAKAESMRAKVWICPERNHLPLRKEVRPIDADGREKQGWRTTFEVEVAELAELSPGVYFPARLQSQFTQGDGGSQAQSDEVLTFSNVQFQPNYPAERFRDLDVAPGAQ